MSRGHNAIPVVCVCVGQGLVETIFSLFFSEIPPEGSVTLHIETTACADTPSEVRYLEHVQAVVSANATRRGDLEFFLTSPMGTR